jgi:hypothetical protein
MEYLMKSWILLSFINKKIFINEENEMFRKKNEIFYVGKVEIIINESTLDVFRNTIYYVDMQDALCIKGVPFITCDIYEDEFSDHLIAQVGLEDDKENDILPSIEELKNKKIVCFIQLDEHIIR